MQTGLNTFYHINWVDIDHLVYNSRISVRHYMYLGTGSSYFRLRQVVCLFVCLFVCLSVCLFLY